MNLKEFKANLLIMDWKIKSESDQGIAWTKGQQTLNWIRREQDHGSELLTHKSKGLRDGYRENINFAYSSFEDCVESLDKRELK